MDIIHEGKTLLAKLGISRCYVVTTTDQFRRLSDAEHRFIFSAGFDDALAFTSPVADVAFKGSYLRYDWHGRGCCIVFRRSPLCLSQSAVLGAMVHEGGHYLEFCNRPERDDTDHERAVKTFWNSMGGNQHGDRWLRATVHLWHRACRLGYEIPFADVLSLEHYGFSQKDLLPLLDEASQREGEAIEAIIGGRGAVAPSRASSPASRKRRTVRFEILQGQPVEFLSGGRLRTFDGIDGTPGTTYKSVREFYAALEAAELARCG